jgi:hypothetical protein
MPRILSRRRRFGPVSAWRSTRARPNELHPRQHITREGDGHGCYRHAARGRRASQADWFTGTVRIDRLFSPPDPARIVGASVTFEA